jgi:hypothetical protein
LITEDFIGNFSKDKLNEISDEPFTRRYSINITNNPNKDVIKERTEMLTNFILTFFNKYKYG